MKIQPNKILFFFFLCFSLLNVTGQTTDVYTTSTNWTVPANVNNVSIKVYGAAGGTGGLDCGAGCTRTSSGPVGYVVANYAVTAGDVIGIYPGGKGVDGANSASNSGGGAGGLDSYPSGVFDGGNGGNAGVSGTSGGGGGGGAASLVTINTVVKIVAGGAGGGGGMANLAGSGMAGSSTLSSNGTNQGGNGTMPAGDGGGGGGGGGGQFASAGGNVHPAGGESAGDGGFLGANTIIGANTITTNSNTVWANGGQIEITYTTVLSVSWLSFNLTPQEKSVLVKWTTASEQNTLNYEVQRSIDGRLWKSIATIAAAGNATIEQHYNFEDLYPETKISYYRILLRDMDNSIHYSKVIVCNLFKANTDLRVYPNPVINKTVTVTISKAASIIIYNNEGKKVLETWIPAGPTKLNLPQLSTGTYWIKGVGKPVMFVVE